MDLEIKMGGAALLRHWLADSGRKSSWLADRLGVSESAVSQWLGGTKSPRPEHAQGIEDLSQGLVRADAW